MKQPQYKEWIKSALIAAGEKLGGFAADFLLWMIGILLFSLPASLSQAISYLITAASRYFLRGKVKYRTQKSGTAKRFFRFLSLSIAGSALLSGSMILLCFGLKISAAAAKILMIPETIWLNDRINRLIFKPKEKKDGEKS